MILGHSKQYFKLFKFYSLKKIFLNLVSHLVLIFDIRTWWATWCWYLKSEPGEPPGVNNWNNCPQTYKQASKQASKHTPYWEDKSLRPYGATKNLPMHHSIFFVIDLNELSKTTRIVVVYRLGIAKSLQGKR